MQHDQLRPESSDQLDKLLAETAAAEGAVTNDVDPDLFQSRLRNRISRSGRQQTLARISVAALILIGLLTWTFQDQLDLDGARDPDVLKPDQAVLLVLDVLEVLAPLNAKTIAQLEASHFDTLEAVDSDIAALPLELLVVGEEERR